MAQTNVTVRLDSAAGRGQKTPFEIAARDDPFYSESNMKALAESIRDAEEGRLTPHELIEAARDDPFYSESNLKALAESIGHLEEGKGVEHELVEVE